MKAPPPMRIRERRRLSAHIGSVGMYSNHAWLIAKSTANSNRIYHQRLSMILNRQSGTTVAMISR